MEVVMGTFVDRNGITDPAHFLARTWDLLTSGPAVVRPKRCGNTEPLRLVEDACLPDVLRDDYIFSNGARCLGMVDRPCFDAHLYFTVVIFLRLRQADSATVTDVYDWLRSTWPFAFCYQATLTESLFRSNLELHQALNSGLVEQDIPLALRNRESFDRLEGGA